MDSFKALLITRDEATKQQSVAETTLSSDNLMDGDVDVRVEYSTINYKDGLAITGKAPVVRRFPMIPGADLAGTVIGSVHPRIRVGDKVVLNGWGLGETHFGGFSQMARVNGDWLIPLPKEFSTADAMAIGTAGYTAMLAVMALERNGVAFDTGPVVVTGAAGGVGSMAVTLLSRLGYEVVAVTGRSHEHDYLDELGAGEVIDRADLAEPAKLLGKERWSGAIDAVGGNVLANLLSMTRRGGAVATCGNASGMELSTSVAPFILRGVSLVGIDSVYQPRERRIEAWSRLARDIDRDKLVVMTTTIPFSGIVNAARDIVQGKVRGRLVVEIG
jgi:acrylyl-CoA reductase (NADPH)